MIWTFDDLCFQLVSFRVFPETFERHFCRYRRAAAQKQRLAPRLRAAPLFAFLLAAQSVFEFAVLQLKGECFAPPLAMICAVAMSRADSGMDVGSSSMGQKWARSFGKIKKLTDLGKNNQI